MKTLNTVNVVCIKSNGLSDITVKSWPDTKQGNIEAESYFKGFIETTDKQYTDEYLEDGIYSSDKQQFDLFLIHST